MSILRVRPREGFKIRDPFTMQIIPPEGADVLVEGEYGTTITKHIRAGDLVKVEDEPKSAVESAPAVASAVEPAPETAPAKEEPAPVKNALREVATDQRQALVEPSSPASADASGTVREVGTDQRKAEGVTAPAKSAAKKSEA